MEYRLKSYVADFRNRFGYNSTEPIGFNSLLQKLDILSIFKPLSEDFSGLSIKDGDSRFMLVNCNHSVGRQNFTIGHELYHLFYDKDFTPHKCQTGLFPRKNGNERMADIFASYLLLPEEGILQLISDEELGKDQIKLATLLRIEQTYGSSRAALLNQLSKMDLASKSFVEKYSIQIKTGARQHGYSVDLYEYTGAKAILGTFGSLANKLFEKDQISESHYQELMLSIGIDVNEIVSDEEN
ncbi:MAG: ImmA/IrrE family metallo-endopeptidase [Mariniphaga sp.]|nr:ImmA/IrrE family metallo-endopeptidase [Mariniphaga sp.]